MELVSIPWLAFYISITFLWSYHCYRAFEALILMPVVRPGSCSSSRAEKEPVSIIIPAKNEEQNIAPCIQSLLHQDHPIFEIIVANDNSTDQTETILRSMGAVQVSDSITHHPANGRPRLRYLNVPPTPPGWTGKNYALHTAVAKATGTWYLFTDADTRHEPASVSSAMHYAVTRKLKFLTLLPRCLTENFLEHLIQPCAMAYIGLWFPIKKINDPHSAVYFANGQYLLIERSHYEQMGGHASVREEFLEDFALMKKTKEKGVKAHCALGAFVYGTRMYDSFGALWKGWRRIFLHAFRKNPLKLLTKSLSLLFYAPLPFACFAPLTVLAITNPESYSWVWLFAFGVLIFILAIGWKAYGIVQARREYALLHPWASVILTGILLDACWMAIGGKKTKWR
ncbi:MAG: glycosyltransferase [Candidatus Omnitrophica bacterium]|nr:glycosyltransferase [Candidatus Omnitrophota bacterium]